MLNWYYMSTWKGYRKDCQHTSFNIKNIFQSQLPLTFSVINWVGQIWVRCLRYWLNTWLTDHLIRIKSGTIFRSNCHLQVADRLSLIFDIQLVDHEVLLWSKINLAKIQIWQREEDIFIGHFQSCSRHILNGRDGAYQNPDFDFFLYIYPEQLRSLA